MTFNCHAQIEPIDLSKPQWVPFTYFDTPSHAVQLQLDCAKLSARLEVDHDRWIDLPSRQLPLAVRQVAGDRLFIVTRALFSGGLAMFIADPTGSLREIPIPPRLQGSVFRQAAAYKDRLFVVLYSVITNRNLLYRLLPDGAGSFQFDDSFVFQLDFDGRYEIATNIHAGVHGDALYLCGEGTRFIYDELQGRPNLTRFSWSGERDAATNTKRSMTLLEMIAGDAGVYGLYQDLDAPWKIAPAPALGPPAQAGASVVPGACPCPGAGAGKPFVLMDVKTLALVKEFGADAVPYGLRFENGAPVVSTLADAAQIQDVLLTDLKNADCSGVMNLGMNNEEGRVAWSQVYYLNGMIDLLHDWGREEFALTSLEPLRAQIKARLDLEMVLLDRLLDDGEPGLVSRRYTMNREPALHAVQTGRILRLFKRYRTETPSPIALANERRLHDMTVNLTGHIEQLVEAESDDRWLHAGVMHLHWPKGCAFPFDGVGIPFNHQNDWSAGVTYAIEPAERAGKPARAARDIVSMFLNVERLREQPPAPPANFQWHYWWGQARAGWSVADGVSVNRPSYGGDSSLAHVSYRTIDAMAVLTVGRAFPELLTPELIDYFKRAVENDGLYLFVCEDLVPMGVVPNVSPALALRSLRMDDPSDLQSAVWAYSYVGLHHR